MGRLRTAMLIAQETEQSLAKETAETAEKMIQLAQQHKSSLDE